MQSKAALDKIINKSRVHLYKPIQIAEILYHHRKGAKIKPADVESYRNVSKTWRDQVTRRLVGRISTSSQKFQDNIFEKNAMPPKLLAELAKANKRTKGAVEAYIYFRLKERLQQVIDARNFLDAMSEENFELETFLALFTSQPGLKRSVDKAYEIVVYALFATIVHSLKVTVTLKIENPDKEILSDFEAFTKAVLGLTKKKTDINVPASIFRVGATNAADRGLDMWTNFGPAVQVKHLSLTEDVAEDVSENITADRIVLVCKDADKEIITRIATQLSFSSRIQSIVTQSDLENWYALCFSKKYKRTLGKQLLTDLQREFECEFPLTTELDSFLKERDYSVIKLKGTWKLK